MKSAEIRVEYVDSMGSDLSPVNAARISFGKATDKMTDRDKKLIKYLADHEHLTPFEHQTLTVIVHCPLFIRSQIHRHRTFAYNEVSRRYTADNLEFYIPPVDDIRKQSKSNKQASDGTIESEDATNAQQMMYAASLASFQVFNGLIEIGVSREQARMVLPQSLMTKFFMTGSLRNWSHFLKLRLDAHAQKEVRMVAEQVSAIIKERWPVSYAALMGEEV